MEVYDHAFNANEWFVILSIIVTNLIMWFAPRIFSKMESIGFYLFGIYIGLFFDHTISIKPWDFYDVNDKSAYEFIDFLSYIMYGPYAYFFLYFYVRWNITRMKIIPYIFVWSAFSLLMEWIGLNAGLFHYDKGYKMYWSFPIYLFSQSSLIVFYNLSVKRVHEINGKN